MNFGSWISKPFHFINLVYVLTRRIEFHKSKFIAIYNLGREIGG